MDIVEPDCFDVVCYCACTWGVPGVQTPSGYAAQMWQPCLPAALTALPGELHMASARQRTRQQSHKGTPRKLLTFKFSVWGTDNTKWESDTLWRNCRRDATRVHRLVAIQVSRQLPSSEPGVVRLLGINATIETKHLA